MAMPDADLPSADVIERVIASAAAGTARSSPISCSVTSSNASSIATRWAQPLCFSSSQRTLRVVITQSRAVGRPTSRANKGVPFQTLGMPSANSGMRKTTLSEITLKSQAVAISAPPPTTWPRMDATVTCGMRSNCSNTRCQVAVRLRRVDQSPSTFG